MPPPSSCGVFETWSPQPPYRAREATCWVVMKDGSNAGEHMTGVSARTERKTVR